MVKREESIKRMRKAFEEGRLGFQMDSDKCTYYDSKTNSCCIIGSIFIDPDEYAENNSGDIDTLEKFGYNSEYCGIEEILEDIDCYDEDFNTGLYPSELSKLQELHDKLLMNSLVKLRNYIQGGHVDWKVTYNEFKDLLYSL